MIDFPDTLEGKLDLVTRFIRDIRRVAHKLGEGGAAFLDLRALYELADLFQRNETNEDVFAIRHQLWSTVKHTYRVIAPCGLGGEGPPWPTVEELLHEAELLAKDVGNAKRAVKRLRSRPLAHEPHTLSHSPTDSTYPQPLPSPATFPHSRPAPRTQWQHAPADQMAGSWSFRSTDESGTRRDESQIHNRTDHRPNTAPMSEDVDTFGDPWHPKPGLSDLVSPSKRPRLDLPASPPVRPILPIASTSHSEKRATPSRATPSLHDLPPPGAPRRRTWPPTDPSYSHLGRAFPSYSSYSHSPPAAATFRPSSYQHDSPPHHVSRLLASYPIVLPRPRYSPPPPTLDHDHSPWPHRLSVPDLSESSSRSQTPSQSPPILAPRPRATIVLPRIVFNEAYAAKLRSTTEPASHAIDGYARAPGTPPAPERATDDVQDSRRRPERPGIGWSPRPTADLPRRYKPPKKDRGTPSPVWSPPVSSGSESAWVVRSVGSDGCSGRR